MIIRDFKKCAEMIQVSVLASRSVCVDCLHKDSCIRVRKINDMEDSEERRAKYRGKIPHSRSDTFDVVILTCDMKNYNRSYRGSDASLYYCVECHAMHHSNSRIGIGHRTKKEEASNGSRQ